jgi:hypothetical protein
MQEREEFLSVGSSWNFSLKQLVLAEQQRIWSSLTTQQALVLAALIPLKRSSKLTQVRVPVAFEQWRSSMAQPILAPAVSVHHFLTMSLVLAFVASFQRFSKV